MGSGGRHLGLLSDRTTDLLAYGGRAASGAFSRTGQLFCLLAPTASLWRRDKTRLRVFLQEYEMQQPSERSDTARVGLRSSVLVLPPTMKLSLWCRKTGAVDEHRTDVVTTSSTLFTWRC